MPAIFRTSRYHGIEATTMELENGKTVAYVKRRFIAPPENYQLLQEHSVSQGERPDHLATQYLGDPEQFWRICDANVVMHPDELTDTIGKKVRITLPEGIPGANPNI
ncbi:MAG: LysM domain-containing protein [Saprospiraceae bacterium]|nr:LysM domain-containing protein [Saprospiraceae bacterium]